MWLNGIKYNTTYWDIGVGVTLPYKGSHAPYIVLSRWSVPRVGLSIFHFFGPNPSYLLKHWSGWPGVLQIWALQGVLHPELTLYLKSHVKYLKCSWWNFLKPRSGQSLRCVQICVMVGFMLSSSFCHSWSPSAYIDIHTFILFPFLST